MAVSAGFVEVNSDTVSVLVDTAETAAEIDVDAAKTAREEAEKAITAAGLTHADDSDIARQALDHAQARLSLAAGK